jgi:hypothetical protein
MAHETHRKSVRSPGNDELPGWMRLRNPILVAHCGVQHVAGEAVDSLERTAVWFSGHFDNS